MRDRICNTASLLVGLLLACIATNAAAAPAVTPDIAPQEKRRGVVERAEKLAQVQEVTPIAGELNSPFNPRDFDKPDPSEVKPTAGPRAASPKLTNAREILENIAPRIQPRGTFNLGGVPMLLVGKSRLKVGDTLQITFEGSDYTVEVAAIEPTTFTLRFRNEEITRPIKSGKSP
jgi:hypothetical protein